MGAYSAPAFRATRSPARARALRRWRRRRACCRRSSRGRLSRGRLQPEARARLHGEGVRPRRRAHIVCAGGVKSDRVLEDRTLPLDPSPRRRPALPALARLLGFAGASLPRGRWHRRYASFHEPVSLRRGRARAPSIRARCRARSALRTSGAGGRADGAAAWCRWRRWRSSRVLQAAPGRRLHRSASPPRRSGSRLMAGARLPAARSRLRVRGGAGACCDCAVWLVEEEGLAVRGAGRADGGVLRQLDAHLVTRPGVEAGTGRPAPERSPVSAGA